MDGEIAIESVRSPDEAPADRADRMLVATVRLQGLRPATRDARLLAYGGSGHPRVVAV